MRREKLFKEAMTASYSLPKVNSEFSFSDSILPALIFAAIYGLLLFLLVKWEGGSIQAQSLAGGVAALFGLIHAMFSRAFVMGYMIKRIMLIILAIVFALCGVTISRSMGW